MPQDEVYQLLKDNKNKPMTNQEIAYILKRSIACVTKSTRVLYEDGKIKRKISIGEPNKYTFTS